MFGETQRSLAVRLSFDYFLSWQHLQNAVDNKREKQEYPTKKTQTKTSESGWTNLFLPSLSKRNGSHQFRVSFLSCVSLLRVTYVQMNMYPFCMRRGRGKKKKKRPSSSASPGDGIDNDNDDDEEEPPRLSLPSSSSPLTLLYLWHIRT